MSLILFSLVSSLSCLLLSIFVWFRDLKNRLNKNFFLFNLGIFLWSSSDFFGVLILDIINESLALNYAKFAQFGGVFLMITMINLSDSLLSLSVKNVSKIERFFRFSYYLFAGTISFLLPFNFIIKSIDNTKVPFEVPGDFYFLFILYFGIGIIYNLARMYAGIKSPEASQKKKQLQYFFWAFIAGLIAVSMALLITQFLTKFDHLIFYIPYLITMGYTVTCGYAIVKHNLFDIGLIFSRSSAVFLASLALILFFLTFEAVVTYFEIGNVRYRGDDILFFLIGSVSSFIVYYFFQKYYKVTDKIFLKGRISIEDAIRDITISVEHIRSFKEMKKILYLYFFESLNFRYVDVMFHMDYSELIFPLYKKYKITSDVLYKESKDVLFEDQYLSVCEVLLLLRVGEEILGIVGLGHYNDFHDFSYNDRKFFDEMIKIVNEKLGDVKAFESRRRSGYPVQD